VVAITRLAGWAIALVSKRSSAEGEDS